MNSASPRSERYTYDKPDWVVTPASTLTEIYHQLGLDEWQGSDLVAPVVSNPNNIR
jgi:hypothetical protein